MTLSVASLRALAPLNVPSVKGDVRTDDGLQEQQDEREQARVRVVLGIFAFTACHALGAPGIWPLTFFFAFYTLVVYLWIRARPQTTPIRRAVAIFGDVATCSVALYLGGEKTMWVYMIYHFILTGNSCRFGGPYFWFNEALAIIGFAIVCWLTPAWSAHPYIAIGFLVALLINPIYAHLFVGRFRRRDREHERLTVQHEAETLARSRFVGSISHDIRTSLGGMKGAGEILARLATTDLQRQTLTVFDTSYRTLNTLLQDLLDLSRLEASKLALESAPFDLHALIRDVELLFVTRAKDKGLAFRIIVSPDVEPFLIGDAPKLERILMNIIGNALKFTHRGFVELRVTGTTHRDVVRFEIRDSGPGIDSAFQPRIFEPFQQGDSSTTREHAGSGLGLSIVSLLSNLMRGKLGLTSQLGVGSTFSIELPLPESDVPPQPLAMTGAVTVYAHCPRDMLRELTNQGLTIIEEPQAATFQQLSPHVPILAHIVSTAHTIASPQAASLSDSRPPAVLVYNDALRAPHSTADYTAIPMVARWWTNAVRLEAYRRGAHLLLAPATAECPPSVPPGCRILCVDDTQSLLWVTEQILLADGYEVVTAPNGRIGLDMLLADPTIALAIVDYHMPLMDGMDMIKHYRQSSRHAQQLPIIMLTASVSHATETAALAGGATLFLLKPFRADELLNAISTLLADPAKTPPPPDKPDTPPCPCIDLSRLRALMRATPVAGFLRKTVELFTQFDAPDALAALETATTATAQRALLHALAGSSANVGAMPFSALCREKMALSDDALTASKDGWAQMLRRELLTVTSELTAAVSQLENSRDSARTHTTHAP